MTRNEVLDKLLSKYGKYGYTRLKISGLIKDGENHGFSYTMIYNGLRMALSSIEDSREELRKNGEDPDDYFVQVTPKELQS